jgi:hypothetical protein
MVGAGAIKPLLELCECNPPNAKIEACAAEVIRHLCAEASNRQLMVLGRGDQGAQKKGEHVPSALVNICSRLHGGPICSFATGALVLLSQEETCRQALVDGVQVGGAGAREGLVVPACVDLLCSSTDHAVLANAAQTIANLALGSTTRASQSWALISRIIKHNAVDALGRICSDASLLAPPAPNAKIANGSGAAAVEGSNSVGGGGGGGNSTGGGRRAVTSAAAALLNLSSGGGAEASADGASEEAVSAASLSAECRVAMVQDGAVYALVGLCNRCVVGGESASPTARPPIEYPDDDDDEAAVLSMAGARSASLAGGGGGVGGGGSGDASKGSASGSNDSMLLGYAAGALANLALEERCRPRMVHEGCVAPLARLCTSSPGGSTGGGISGSDMNGDYDELVLGNAVQALASLTLDTESVPRMLQHDLVGTLAAVTDKALSLGLGLSQTRNRCLHSPCHCAYIHHAIMLTFTMPLCLQPPCHYAYSHHIAIVHMYIHHIIISCTLILTTVTAHCTPPLPIRVRNNVT